MHCYECEAKTGDVIQDGDELLICLGKEIAFPELITNRKKQRLPKELIIAPGLLSEATCAMLHRFVEYRFTSYHNATPMWLGTDLPLLISKSKKKASKKPSCMLERGETTLLKGAQDFAGQQLIVVPDIWTLYQLVPQEIRDEETTCILHGQSTVLQKCNAFRGIKTGAIRTLICTYSQIFQDRSSLKRIMLIDGHTWRYKNQQDPRRYVPTTLSYLSKQTGADYQVTGIPLLSVEP